VPSRLGPDVKIPLLVVGIGNILMGDEGVGVAVVRWLEQRPLPAGVTCLDGGTGGFHLLGVLQQAGHVVLVDATVDGAPVGTVRRLVPRYSTDYPRTLTAHDIGLKDLLDAFYLLGDPPHVTLFAVSIAPLQELRLGLSAALAARVPEIAAQVYTEVCARVAAEP
jgi:hydrogenase maturation protease